MANNARLTFVFILAMISSISQAMVAVQDDVTIAQEIAQPADVKTLLEQMTDTSRDLVKFAASLGKEKNSQNLATLGRLVEAQKTRINQFIRQLRTTNSQLTMQDLADMHFEMMLARAEIDAAHGSLHPSVLGMVKQIIAGGIKNTTVKVLVTSAQVFGGFMLLVGVSYLVYGS